MVFTAERVSDDVIDGGGYPCAYWKPDLAFVPVPLEDGLAQALPSLGVEVPPAPRHVAPPCRMSTPRRYPHSPPHTPSPHSWRTA